VPVLLELAASAKAEDSQVGSAAMSALENLPGDDVDAALRRRLADTQGTERQLVIRLIGLRRIDAVPALREAANDPDADIRAAALLALGSVVDLDELPVLIQRVVSPKNPEDAEAARQALRVACVRMPDREACAAKLVAAMSPASVAAQGAILEVLGAMGGTTALEAVGQAGQSGQPALQDTATRLLGEWMTVDAAPVLLKLAQTPDNRYAIRALRGYLRIARQFDVPDRQRAEMCRSAWQAAQRDEEKKLVLEVLQRYPSVDTLRLAVEAAKNPTLEGMATEAAMTIAQKIGGDSDAAKQLLAQLVGKPMRVEITKAQYGAGDTWKDVTQTVRQQVRDLPLIVLNSSSYNASFGGDPAPGTRKQLKVQYRIDGQPGEATFAENATILLPIPK
jgi:hypothetical protein